jgi:hypothetical protein
LTEVVFLDLDELEHLGGVNDPDEHEVVFGLAPNFAGSVAEQHVETLPNRLADALLEAPDGRGRDRRTAFEARGPGKALLALTRTTGWGT